MMEKGVAMNDMVAQSKSAMDKFTDGDKNINTGMGTKANTIQFVHAGEGLYSGK